MRTAYALFETESNEIICVSEIRSNVEEYLCDIFMDDFYVEAIYNYYHNNTLTPAEIAKQAWDYCIKYYGDESLVYIVETELV